MWLVREYTHVDRSKWSHGPFALADGAAALARVAAAGARPVPAYALTASAWSAKQISHPDARGIHWDDRGRTLLAQLVLNGLGHHLRAGGNRSAFTRRARHGRGRAQALRRVRWSNATSVPRVGYCDVTSDEGDCVTGDKGYWSLARRGIGSFGSCAGRCRACARCRFVSYSPAHDECAWYHSCALPLETGYQGDTYQTLRVKSTTPSTARTRRDQPGSRLPRGATQTVLSN